MGHLDLLQSEPFSLMKQKCSVHQFEMLQCYMLTVEDTDSVRVSRQPMSFIASVENHSTRFNLYLKYSISALMNLQNETDKSYYCLSYYYLLNPWVQL